MNLAASPYDPSRRNVGTSAQPRPPRRADRLFGTDLDGGDPQSQGRAGGYGSPGVSFELWGNRLDGDNGVVPVVELDHLGQQFSAEAMSITDDRVDDQPAGSSHLVALYRGRDK